MKQRAELHARNWWGGAFADHESPGDVVTEMRAEGMETVRNRRLWVHVSRKMLAALLTAMAGSSVPSPMPEDVRSHAEAVVAWLKEPKSARSSP